jgi:hypothetical protein
MEKIEIKRGIERAEDVEKMERRGSKSISFCPYLMDYPQ